jgi:hypothetical protein
MNTPTPPAGYKLVKGEDIKDRVPEGALYWIPCGEEWDEVCYKKIPPESSLMGAFYAIPETKPEPVANNPLSQQEGGNHYKGLAIQPVEFIQANKLSFLEGCVVKRVCRHRAKNKAEDIRKAIHELRLILKLEYGEES